MSLVYRTGYSAWFRQPGRANQTGRACRAGSALINSWPIRVWARLRKTAPNSNNAGPVRPRAAPLRSPRSVVPMCRAVASEAFSARMTGVDPGMPCNSRMAAICAAWPTAM